MFHTVLGFNEKVDILALPLPETFFAPPPSDNEILVIQSWGLYTSEPYREIAFRFDKQTRILKQISFYFMGTDDTGLSPDRVMRELGIPQFIFIKVRPTEVMAMRAGGLELVYKDGLVFFYQSTVQAERIQTGDWQAEFCFSEKFRNPSSFTLIKPLSTSDDLTNLLSSQQATIQPDLDEFVPIDQAFGVSILEFSTEVERENNTCFYMKVEP